MSKENSDKCKNCNGMCCKYVALEIDAPEEIKDFENIKWYVCHKNVNVFVDEDDEWYIEFLTPCEHLNENNLCNNYEKRPQVCRDYSREDCLFHNNDYTQKYTFKKQEDVEQYIEEIFNKGLHKFLEEEE